MKIRESVASLSFIFHIVRGGYKCIPVNNKQCYLYAYVSYKALRSASGILHPLRSQGWAKEGLQVHEFDLTEGARSNSSLCFADEQKLVRKRKCMKLELFLPGSPGGSNKKTEKNYARSGRKHMKNHM